MSYPSSPARRISMNYAWLVVGLLWVISCLNYLDRLMITTMRDPIIADIHMTDAQFGLLTSVFLWVYAAASPLGGFVADRVGRRGIIIVSLLFWSLATFISGTSHSLSHLLFARCLMGLSEACYLPAALALISDYHRGPTRSLATGVNMTGIYAGAALGGIGGVLAEHLGWRYGFQIFGVIGIAYAILLFFCLRDAPSIADDNPAPTDSEPANTSSESLSVMLGKLFAYSGFWILLIINILASAVGWAIYGWMPSYLKNHFHLGLGAAGMSATTYIQISSFVGVILAGALADRWSRRTDRARAFIPAIGYLATAPFVILVASTDFLPLALASLVIIGLGRGAMDANLMPLLRQVVSARHSATGYGLLNMVGTAMGGIMVYAGGALMDAHIGLSVLFQASGVGLFLAGALFFVIRIPR